MAAADSVLALYHLYRDHTFFTYEVVLTRDDEENGMQGERYILAVSAVNLAWARLPPSEVAPFSVPRPKRDNPFLLPDMLPGQPVSPFSDRHELSRTNE